ncbi:unnamed protein product [Callosobruchus maculatus]|uniref:Uncharacterized protein n=1 Tax=Callosobruchus maculatus TaxID=64391 RepID=A0A653BXQ5_CALMS|nr:unnamed protein product [Callosobruchus maculatus]
MRGGPEEHRPTAGVTGQGQHEDMFVQEATPGSGGRIQPERIPSTSLPKGIGSRRRSRRNSRKQLVTHSSQAPYIRHHQLSTRLSGVSGPGDPHRRDISPS